MVKTTPYLIRNCTRNTIEVLDFSQNDVTWSYDVISNVNLCKILIKFLKSKVFDD